MVTTLLMKILKLTWRKNKNNVQEIKEKYNTIQSLSIENSNPSIVDEMSSAYFITK